MTLRDSAARASLLALLASAAAHAQTPPRLAAETPAGTAASAPAAAAQPAADPAPYQDRIIEGLPPAPVDNGLGPPGYDASGWPRLLRLETRLGNQAFDTERRTRLALALYGLIDTPNHGALSLDGSLTPSDRSGSFTIRQRGLPLERGWQANHEAGVITSPATGLARQPSRVYLPSTTLLGASGEWSQNTSGLSLIAGSGQPGRLQGHPGNGFKGLGGRRTTLAAQWRPFEASEPADPFAAPGSARLPGLTLALQHERASGLPTNATAAANADESPPEADANATLVAARFERDTLRLQAQAMGSHSGAGISNALSENTSARGYWLDTEWEQGPRTHGLSLYRLEPGLRWAGQAMPDDLKGLAVKTGWRTRQWSADASIDWLNSISGARASGSYATASARWRLNRRESLGMGGALRQFGGSAWSSYGDWRFENSWGNGGLRLEINGGANSPDEGQHLSFDQEWAVPQGFSLSTSLGAGRETRSATSADPGNASNASNASSTNEILWSAAVAVGAPIGQRANLRSTLRTEQSNRGRRDHSLSISALWRITPDWSFETQYNRSLGQRNPATPSIDPLAPIVDTTTTEGDHTLYAVLRYEAQAGSQRIPLGGKPTEGGGRIEGTVFFDANRSGVQEAGESGVANALIYLDNRFAVRTDAQGRFEFPLVAPGPRTITLRNDTLPLPWNAANEGQARVDMRLRETTRLSLPVVKN